MPPKKKAKPTASSTPVKDLREVAAKDDVVIAEGLSQPEEPVMVRVHQQHPRTGRWEEVNQIEGQPQTLSHLEDPGRITRYVEFEIPLTFDTGNYRIIIPGFRTQDFSLGAGPVRVRVSGVEQDADNPHYVNEK